MSIIKFTRRLFQRVSRQRQCPTCGSLDVKLVGPISKNRPQTFSISSFSLVECEDCDVIFLGQTLTDDDFRRMYQNDIQFGDSVYRDEENVESAKSYYGGCYRQMVAEMNLAPSECRVLEAGAGRAWMCMVAKEIGAGLTVAQDVTAECSQECPWVEEYVVGDLSNERISARGPYHVISTTHVIEHVPDPVRFMGELRKHLAPEGRLFVTAPHRPENWERGSIPQWEAWSYNHVPLHLQYFSERAVARMAAANALQIDRWSLHENGQAFEAVLKAA